MKEISHIFNVTLEWSLMDYLSCFSGIGGLEGSTSPLAICEIDANCRKILKNKFPDAQQFHDIKTMPAEAVSVVTGGWPCQDLSIAGKQRGLSGENSGLFYAFTALAVASGADTVIAENVPNLLRMEGGLVFSAVLEEFHDRGFQYCAWRSLNARQFGLPHSRNRVFMVASKSREACLTLFRSLPQDHVEQKLSDVAGFYWTAGTHSICYSKGYVPAIKIGSTISIPSPPAIHYHDTVRQLTATEALKLQGFNIEEFQQLSPSVIFKMAGNAVARPVGRFVVDGVLNNIVDESFTFSASQPDLFNQIMPSSSMPKNGFFENGCIRQVEFPAGGLIASNLDDFIDFEEPGRLSKRAALGLLSRLKRSEGACPEDLHNQLNKITGQGG